MNAKEELMIVANAIKSNNREVLRSDTLKTAHHIIKLKKRLRENHYVEFRFFKKNGELRTAKGTLHPVVVNEYVKGTWTGRTRPDIIKYFDLERNQFRSFAAIRYVEIVDIDHEVIEPYKLKA